MKNFIALLVALIAGCTFNVNLNKNIEASWNPKEAYKSVAKIVAVAPGIGEMSGTGFAIDDKHLITAGHVCIGILEGEQEKITDGNIYGETYDLNMNVVRYTGLKIEAIDTFNDLCILTWKNHGLQPVKIANDLPDIHSTVYIVGAPLGYAFTINKGELIIKDKTFDIFYQHKIIVDADAAPGNSGSPIFNASGSVIGVLVAGDEAYDKGSIGTALLPLKRFIHIVLGN
jgi:V8-like Glu-specific endopeptidase